jgi:hypothetical protein
VDHVTAAAASDAFVKWRRRDFTGKSWPVAIAASRFARSVLEQNLLPPPNVRTLA